MFCTISLKRIKDSELPIIRHKTNSSIFNPIKG